MNITYLDSKCNEYINELIVNYPNFSEKEFEHWLVVNDIQNKSNPSAYVFKVFKRELENGKFDKRKRPSVSAQPLFTAMRNNGIQVIQRDTGFISLLLQYLIDNDLLEIEEIVELNKYIVEELSIKSSTDYVVEIKKELAARQIKVDYEYLRKEHKKLQDEWAALIKELEG